MFVHESLVEVLVEVLAELPSPPWTCIVIGFPVPARETRVARASGFTSGCDDLSAKWGRQRLNQEILLVIGGTIVYSSREKKRKETKKLLLTTLYCSHNVKTQGQHDNQT